MKLDNLSHLSFPQPDNPDEKIWRYLSLAKFLDFLLTESLYFSRVDLLKDSYEGTFTKKTENPVFANQTKLPSGLIVSTSEYNDRLRKSKHVSCWRLSKYDSVAMWDSYCSGNEGVALQTTYSKLVNSLPDEKGIFIGLITYLDYEIDSFNSDNTFNAFMHKRVEFENEKEVRIVKTFTEYMNDHNLPCPSEGIRIKTDLIANLETIFVNPFAEGWYLETIQALLNKLNINISVKWSEIK